jgi:GTPase SAR1 family protein
MNLISNKIFYHPFCCMVAGPSSSGKSHLIQNILENLNSIIDQYPNKIVYCYGRWDDKYNNLKRIFPNIILNEGLPDISDFSSNNINLLILDDLMQESKEKSVCELFTTDSHHLNISVFFTSQNLFSNIKNFRTISINCQYMILLNNPRERSQIYTLARQMYPKNPNFLLECYEDATNKPHGYLFLDLKQTTPNEFRVQTDILGQRIIYKPKK